MIRPPRNRGGTVAAPVKAWFFQDHVQMISEARIQDSDFLPPSRSPLPLHGAKHIQHIAYIPNEYRKIRLGYLVPASTARPLSVRRYF